MRVLMTADTVGGVFTYSTDLIAALCAEGVEVTLVTFGRIPTAHQRHRLRESGVARVIETELALEWMPRPWRDVAEGERRLLELERELAPDVVHLNAYAHGSAPFKAPVLVVGHSCVLSWWAAVHGQAPPPEWERYRTAVRRGLAGAAAVVAPSHTMLSELKRCYGPLRAPGQVILNGSAHVGDGAPRRRAIVLGSGRLWDAAKNANALCHVARRCGLRGRVFLAGEADDASAGDGAQMLGVLTPQHLAEIRREALVYAAPARYEPFGLGILEAARDGCALVLGDIPSLRELWDGDAVFVDPADESRLGDTLERLLGDPAMAAHWGERAQRRSGDYSVLTMAASYRDLYRRLAGSRQAAAA